MKMSFYNSGQQWTPFIFLSLDELFDPRRNGYMDVGLTLVLRLVANHTQK